MLVDSICCCCYKVKKPQRYNYKLNSPKAMLMDNDKKKTFRRLNRNESRLLAIDAEGNVLKQIINFLPFEKEIPPWYTFRLTSKHSIGLLALRETNQQCYQLINDMLIPDTIFNRHPFAITVSQKLSPDSDISYKTTLYHVFHQQNEEKRIRQQKARDEAMAYSLGECI